MNDADKKSYAIEESESVSLDLTTSQLSEALGWPLKPRDALCWLTKIQLWFNAGFKTLVKLPAHAIDSKGHRDAMKALYLEGTAWVPPDTLVFYSDNLQQPIGGDGNRPVALSDVLLSKEEVDSLCARLKAKKYTDPNDSNISQDWDFTVLEKDEVADAEHFIAWRDIELDAKNWWERSKVTPAEAAMLMCYCKPDRTLDPKAVTNDAVTNDETGPSDFERLLCEFNYVAEAEADPKPRKLSQWLTIANDKGLKHHSWIEKYQKARLLIGQDSPAANIEPAPEQEQAGSEETTGTPQEGGQIQEGITADDDLAALFDPVSVQALETHFPGDWTTWAQRPKRHGLDLARRGRKKYNPYVAAIWWLDKCPTEKWAIDRVYRTLVHFLPARSRDSKHLLTGELD